MRADKLQRLELTARLAKGLLFEHSVRDCFANDDRRACEPMGGYDQGVRCTTPEFPEASMSRTRRRYPSELSNAEWALLEPLLASSERGELARRSGPPSAWPTPSSTC
jgi:hypothetical protein